MISSSFLKPDGVPGHLRLAARQLVELVELDAEDRLERAEVAGLLGAGDVEEQHLGLLDEILRLALAALDRLLDPLRGAEQPPQHRVLLDDLGVVAGVAGDRGRRGERVDDVLAAGLLELALAARAARATVSASTGWLRS